MRKSVLTEYLRKSVLTDYLRKELKDKILLYTIMKCSKCKCIKNIDDFTLLKNGNMKKTCNKCSKVKKELDNEEKQKCKSCKCFRNVSSFKKLDDDTTHKTCVTCSERQKTRKECKSTDTDKSTDIMTFIRHQKTYQKLLNEFKDRASQAVHFYDTKNLFVDIRDRWNPSDDRDNSFCNGQWFSTFVI